MEASLRHRLGPIAGIVTLAIGFGFVSVIQMFASLFADPVATPKVGSAEVLIARPGENPDPAAPTKLELSCYDPQILPVWKELKKDADFAKWIDEAKGTFSCSEMLDVRSIDLNVDGTSEILARGKDFPLCGIRFTGCGMWAFEKRGVNYKTILSNQDAADVTDLAAIVRKSRTRGYSDLLLKIRVNSWETMYSTLKFNGREYVETRCVYEIPNTEHRSEDSWRLVPCSESDDISY